VSVVTTPGHEAVPLLANTVSDALQLTTERLAEAGIETARVDAEHLLAHVLRTGRAGLYAASRRRLSVEEERAFDVLVARRARREPLAYVVREWGFRRLILEVDPRVLVPRPETEIVVERALALLGHSEAPRVLDVGTGSGAIALAIADEHPGALVTGIDASGHALAVARMNVSRTGLAVELRREDLFDGLPPGPWDLVVSNPPYVGPDEIDLLEPEVRDWEPRAALVGDGATEAVATGARGALAAGGALVLEAHADRAFAVADLLRGSGFVDVLVTRDLSGRPRVVEGRRP
jgi:release factor glutamine methyltransferase